MTTAVGLMTYCSALALLLCFTAGSASMAPEAQPLPPSMAAPPGPSCMDALLNLSSCLTYVEAGSKTNTPDAGCCPSFAYLVANTPQCLCELLAGAAENYGISIDNAKALKLPSVCKVNTPPVSMCALVGIPVPSNLMGPSPSPLAGGSGSPTATGPSIPGSSPLSSPPPAQNKSPSLRGASLVQLGALACTLAIVALL